MKEYGGYIEFENYHGNMLHEGAVSLNCGRAALEYLCEAKEIKKLFHTFFIVQTPRLSLPYESAEWNIPPLPPDLPWKPSGH